MTTSSLLQSAFRSQAVCPPDQSSLYGIRSAFVRKESRCSRKCWRLVARSRGVREVGSWFALVLQPWQLMITITHRAGHLAKLFYTHFLRISQPLSDVGITVSDDGSLPLNVLVGFTWQWAKPSPTPFFDLLSFNHILFPLTWWNRLICSLYQKQPGGMENGSFLSLYVSDSKINSFS